MWHSTRRARAARRPTTVLIDSGRTARASRWWRTAPADGATSAPKEPMRPSDPDRPDRPATTPETEPDTIGRLTEHRFVERRVADRRVPDDSLGHGDVPPESDEMQYYRAVFDALTEALCVLEMTSNDGDAPEDRFLEVNAAFRAATGLSPAAGPPFAEARRQRVLRLAHQQDPATERRVRRRVLLQRRLPRGRGAPRAHRVARALSRRVRAVGSGPLRRPRVVRRRERSDRLPAS